MIYRGEVSKVTTRGVWVSVPDIVPGFDFGPCQSTATVKVGDRVVVADVSESTVDPDLIVIGVLG